MKKTFVITIDGPAASGKTSTAQMVADALGYIHIDSGSMYREETARRVGVSDIRSPEVTAQVSAVAKIPEVRAAINARIKEVADEQGKVVADGRDMGTAVFPEAQVKIFLVADSWERARRRLLQRLNREGTKEEIAIEAELLAHRDTKDATQTTPATNAIFIDTTHITQAEQVERIVALAKAAQTAIF